MQLIALWDSFLHQKVRGRCRRKGKVVDLTRNVPVHAGDNASIDFLRQTPERNAATPLPIPSVICSWSASVAYLLRPTATDQVTPWVVLPLADHTWPSGDGK